MSQCTGCSMHTVGRHLKISRLPRLSIFEDFCSQLFIYDSASAEFVLH